MKKRFLVLAMACAVTLGGFAGFVNAADEVTGPRVEENKKVADKEEEARLYAIIVKAITENYDKDATDEEVAAFQKYYGIETADEAWAQLCDAKKAWIAANPWAKVVDKYNEKNDTKKEEPKKEEATAKPAAKKALPNTAAVR